MNTVRFRLRRFTLSVLPGVAVSWVLCGAPADGAERKDPGAELYQKHCASCHGERGRSHQSNIGVERAASRVIPSLDTGSMLQALTTDEFKVIKKHPSTGARMVTTAKSLPPKGDIVVAQHHERLDGQGYPWGLKANDIHPLSRICSIADVFDALTSPRSYRNFMNSYEALKIMKFKEHGKFDAAVLDAFIRMMTAG